MLLFKWKRTRNKKKTKHNKTTTNKQTKKNNNNKKKTNKKTQNKQTNLIELMKGMDINCYKLRRKKSST